jgi:cell division protein FtsB
MMAEELSERLELLERSVKQAAEAIAALRKERDALSARVAQLEQEHAELVGLRQERKASRAAFARRLAAGPFSSPGCVVGPG